MSEDGDKVACDIVRFDESGGIAEHWNIQETIPPKSAWKNENGKF
ncbi:hypothetical protein [Alloscardovia macacae]|nr:hypothetical protein [Alloscardovia macacae]